MNMTQNKTSNESKGNNQKRFFSLEWEKSLHEMARMEWSQRDSLRPAAWIARNKHTALDSGMETAEVEDGYRAKQDTQAEE